MNCKYGNFIYNSTTNSFLKIDSGLLDTVEKLKNGTLQIEELTEALKNIFLTHHILVSEEYDDKYLAKLKYMHQKFAFADSRLLLTIATTTECNFRCPYCYEAGITGNYMKEDTEKAILDYINSIKPRKLNITWYGGEPLMNFDSIKRLTSEIDKLKFIEELEYTMVTNGALLTEDVCQFFVHHNLKKVQITIDGLEANHNKSRISKNGKPSYSVILHNLSQALEFLPECYFSVRVNISQGNREDYPLLYKELHKKFGGKNNFSVYFSFVEDYNMCIENNILNSKERIEFLRYLKDVYHIYENKYPKHEISVCQACQINSFVIGPDGDLYKCWNEIGRKDFVVGNIKNKKMISNYDLISEYAIRYNKFNDFQCLDCFLLPVCVGGCPNYRYTTQMESCSVEICPYNLKHIDTTLELMYERVILHI